MRNIELTLHFELCTLHFHQGMARPSRKKPPVGPPSGSVAAQTIPRAPSSTGRPPDPPMSVATHPGHTAFTRMPLPSSSSASMTVSPFSASFEILYAGVEASSESHAPAPLDTFTI